MASISSQIKLMDVVSAPLANISGALGNVISSFEAMQSACDNSVDVANFTEARNKILEASAEVGRLEQKLQSLTSPDINIPVKWDMQSSATMPSFDTIQPTYDNSVDIANLAEARNKIVEVSVEVGKLDAQLQNLTSPNIDIPVKWNIQSGTDIFSGTGAERLTNEVQALDDMLDNVLKTQQSIGTQALQIGVLPPEASWDINFINQKVEELGNKMSELQGIDTSGFNDADISQLSNSYENLRSGMTQIINIQESMNQAIANGDVSALNNGYNELSSIAERVERQVRNNINAVQEFNNIDWQSASSPVTFTTTGLERYKQEIQSANDMISNLTTTQQQIHNQASKTNIFPDSMIVDINQVNDRISKLKAELVSISNRPMDGLGADQASKQIEMLRSQLHQALETQNDLNSAVERMDISSANQAYLKLNSTIDTTERNIRDNFSEQNNFNASINKGVNSASKLESKIAGFIAAYASIRTIGEVINLSDRMTQTSARLEMIVDDGGSVQELQNKIHSVAQGTRADYMNTADIISKLGIQASKAFTTNDELLAFTEQLNKQFTIAGSTQQEVSSASLQLSQALGSGVLRGEELNAVFEAAPNVIQTIADYLGEDIGMIREMASEGQITADVVKNAMLAAADETNAKFAQMPMTFGQVFTKFKNDALIAFKPILNRLNALANSDSFDTFVSNITNAIINLSAVVIEIFDIIGQTGAFIYDNWSIIEPIILGAVIAMGLYKGALVVFNVVQAISSVLQYMSAKAVLANTAAHSAEAVAIATATVAQAGFNAALLACPLTWIIIAIIAVIVIIYAVVAAINKAEGTTISATGIIMGALVVALAFLANLVYGIIDIFIGVFAAIWNIVAAFVNFFANVWSDPIGATVRLFIDLGDAILSIIEGIAKGIDKIMGTDLAGSVQGWRSDMQAWADEEFGPAEIVVPKFEDTDAYAAMQIDRISYDDAYDAGYFIGEAVEDKFDIGSAFNTDVPKASDYTNDYTHTPSDELLKGISDDTSDIKDAVDISQEDLKYLRDIAERDVINRFTTAEIHVDMGGITNTVNKDTDLDGVVDYMVTGIEEALAIVAEGVHE